MILTITMVIMTGCSSLSSIKLGGSYELDGKPVGGEIELVFDEEESQKEKAPVFEVELPSGEKKTLYTFTKDEVEKMYSQIYSNPNVSRSSMPSISSRYNKIKEVIKE